MLRIGLGQWLRIGPAHKRLFAPVNNPLHILRTLDRHLAGSFDLSVYGRSALALGYAESAERFQATMDVDLVRTRGATLRPNIRDSAEGRRLSAHRLRCRVGPSLLFIRSDATLSCLDPILVSIMTMLWN